MRVPTALLGVDQDTLTPPWQLRELSRRIGAPCWLETISSIYGHDAFLKEEVAVASFLTRAQQEEVRHAA